MVLCVKAPLKHAQELKRFLTEKGIYDYEYSIRKTKTHIYFPIKRKTGIKSRFKDSDITDTRLAKRQERKKGLVSAVSSRLSEEELAVLRRAFDITGTIAILEVPDELESKEKLLADTLLKVQKNVKTVLKKAGIHGTEFRTQKMRWLAGEKTKETIHKELGIRLKLDVEKVYFSPRLSTERKRIAEQVKPGEDILVMFSGCAPYPCILAKKTKAKHITGIELNPKGHAYGVENLALNKVTNVTLYNGDVKEVVPKLKKKFDRIVMPLPKSAGDFLDTAIKVSKKGTIINFYAFEELGRFNESHNRIRAACKRQNKECRVIRTVKCGQHAPRTYRICVDFRLL